MRTLIWIASTAAKDDAAIQKPAQVHVGKR